MKPAYGRRRDLMQLAAAIVGTAAAAQVIESSPAAAAPEGLDVHAALNTYEVSDRPQGITFGGTGRVEVSEVVGANGRRLLLRDADDGIWIGGCLITDPFVLARLGAELTHAAERMGNQ